MRTSSCGADPRERPAATRSSSRRWSRSSATPPTATSRFRRRSRRCSPHGSTSSTRRARSARARLGRGRALPPRRRRGPRPSGAQVDPRLSRSCARTSSVRNGAAGGRGRVSLPPPADPRRRLRGACRRQARRPARALRLLARGARRRSRRARRVLGYHLEQAFRYRSELGPVSDDDRRAQRVPASCWREPGGERTIAETGAPPASLLERSAAAAAGARPAARTDAAPHLGRGLTDIGRRPAGEQTSIRAGSSRSRSARAR